MKNSDSWLPVPLPILAVTLFSKRPPPLQQQRAKDIQWTHLSSYTLKHLYYKSMHKTFKDTRKVFVSKLSSRVKTVWWPLMSFHTAGFSFWKLPLLMNTRLLSSPLFSPSTPSHKISWSSGHKEHPLSSGKSSLCSHFATPPRKCKRSTIFPLLCKKSGKNRWRHHLIAILLQRKWCPAEMLQNHNLHFIFHVLAVLMRNSNLLLSFESSVFLSTHHKEHVVLHTTYKVN